MQYWWLVGVGGALGSIARFAVTVFLPPVENGFPWNTLLVNLAGSLLIGICAAAFSVESAQWRLLCMTGFLGGFTTFSAFSLENMRLIQAGQVLPAVVYSGVSVIAGVLLTWTGYIIFAK